MPKGEEDDRPDRGAEKVEREIKEKGRDKS